MRRGGIECRSITFRTLIAQHGSSQQASLRHWLDTNWLSPQRMMAIKDRRRAASSTLLMTMR